MSAVRAAATVTPLPDWGERNRAWLIAAIERLRTRIERGEPGREPVVELATVGVTPALVQVIRLLRLSPFEGELLLLLAGLALDQRLATLLGERSPAMGGHVSYAAAFELLATPHWDALSPDAPLRYWRVVTPAPDAPIAQAPLQLDERLLHYVAGVRASDPVLAALARPVATNRAPGEELAPPVDAFGDALARAAERASIVVLRGGEQQAAARRDLALAAAGRSMRSLLWLDAHDLPTEPDALRTIALHLAREAALTAALPVVAVGEAHAAAALGLASRLPGPLLWLGGAGPARAGLPPARHVVTFDLPAPDAGGTAVALQRRWRDAGGDESLAPALDAAGRQFHLEADAVDQLVEQLAATASEARAARVWPAARAASRGGLDAIAQRIEADTCLADVVLPPSQRAMLGDIARQLHHAERVYREWGFATPGGRGQGLVALFTGESGTGKTLAAEAIAREVGLDLYRIDLAAIVSKYIGETEKNLRRLFDAAETSGAVLLFDEADALFGKRSDVKDSHDRYANIEVAYLLQRMESYRGLAILTTNMKSALDRAFLRRIRFVVTFPLPDAAAREQIWRRLLPATAPLGAIDFPALARLSLTGGNIRSIAVNAAFKAADAATPIGQTLLVAAAREEFAKLERSFGGMAGREA